MAIQKEIWVNHIVEGLFADNSFLSKARNHDEFVVGGKVVHIPQAGAASGVSENRTTLPATVSKRTDTDITYNLSEFTTDPILVPHADTVELSYSKRESVLGQDRKKLADVVAMSFLYNWSPSSGNTILTTGSSVSAHSKSATGNRKAFTKADVLAAMTKFNDNDIPQEGRYLLVDAQM